MIARLVPEDLRLRLIAAFVLVACLSQLSQLPVAGAALAVLAVASFGRVPLRRLRHVEGFVLLLFVMLPFTLPGTPLLTLGPLEMSREGLARAALLACKVLASALVLLAFLGAVEPARLGAALHALRLPEPLVRIFALTPRYLALIRDEIRRLHEAMRARGFRPGTNRHSWRSYGNLIGMVILRALDRTRRVDEAMRCRGFTGRFPHAALPRPGLRDWRGVVLTAGLGVVLVLADRG
ncbi:cobalt ECF transporter T component CbiQ [Sinirhodobacter populi]|uniref:Cobalt ECF transporter T component CbiQ n=1 Tax=Paenirhodobacter populi TaxID=2306993 RepID=A0A443KGE3_9RHOB|nr:cobalt ECF transporter T component CbiQ [Sinirhodobacter populi]RWR31820.1 cobalt ECF transporter T component CbiQ [Sinirhodobacter populi]